LRRGLAPRRCRRCRHRLYTVTEIHSDRRCLLVDSIYHESRDVLIAGVAAKENKAAKPMPDQTLSSFEIDLLHGFRGERNRSRNSM